MNKTQEKITKAFTIDHAKQTIEALQKGCDRVLKQEKTEQNAIGMFKIMSIQTALTVAHAAVKACCRIINHIDD